MSTTKDLLREHVENGVRLASALDLAQRDELINIWQAECRETGDSGALVDAYLEHDPDDMEKVIWQFFECFGTTHNNSRTRAGAEFEFVRMLKARVWIDWLCAEMQQVIDQIMDEPTDGPDPDEMWPDQDGSLKLQKGI